MPNPNQLSIISNEAFPFVVALMTFSIEYSRNYRTRADSFIRAVWVLLLVSPISLLFMAAIAWRLS
jgi:hypothetical protein